MTSSKSSRRPYDARHRASPSPAPDSPPHGKPIANSTKDTRPRAGCRKNDKPSLSSRERDVLRLYAHGSSTDEIAALLNVSKGSVFTYVNRACRKLHAADRKEALAICARYDLL